MRWRAPPCTAGLRHEFQYEDGGRFTRRIVKREGELCVLGTLVYDKDWVLVKQVTSAGEEITSARPDYPLVGSKWLDFPLSVGKEWQLNYRSRFGTRAGVGYFQNFFSVISYENLTTRAGVFAAFKIKQEQRHGSGSWGIRYFWYAPESEYYVKHEYARSESSDPNYWLGGRNYELVSMTRPRQ